MMRAAFFLLVCIAFLSTSCEKCKQCSFTYEVTTIIQTVNGEEEVTTTISGQLQGPDSTTFSQECIKGDESFTIEEWYKMKKDTTVLDNFQYTCTDI
jgi:hypothetical protein